jgi:hypothetical protein
LSESNQQRLEVDTLIEEAREKTGLHDFGELPFRDGLEKLVETYNGEANLTEKGIRRQARRLRNLLKTRLQIQQAWKDNPALVQQQIESPLYVVSLPRTGTSALYNLLSEDPAHRPLLFWEGKYPNPIDVPKGEEDPRFVALRDALSRARKNNPQFTAIHFTRADGPEECVTLMELAFDGAQQGMEPLMEPYGSWFRNHSLDPLYDDYRKLLSTLQYQRPGERWLLKSPAHLWGLDQIIRLFPDACIVQTHRNPTRAIASYCSMIEALMLNRRSIDRDQLGERVLDYLASSMDRALDVRESADASRFFDVYFEDLLERPVETVRSIYDAFQLEWSESIEELVRARAEEDKKGKHGSHDYSLDDYGLSERDVEQRFERYLSFIER